MSRFAIFGYYGQGNAGDEAILAAFITGINSKISGANISVYSANPRETEVTHGVKAYHFFPLDMKGSIIAFLGRKRTNFFRSLVNFFRSDVIVIGGGGLLFDTPETNKWMMGYLHLINYANCFKKKIALMGISVGPLYHESSRQKIGKALHNVDLISVRDQASRDLLLSCGVNDNIIHVIPDLVFTLTPADSIRIEKILNQEAIERTKKKIIALTPCSYNSGNPRWIDQYVALCAYVVNNLSAEIWLIPMQQSIDHDDRDAIEKIYKCLDNTTSQYVKVFKGQYLPGEVQGLIKEVDFVLAERLHGSIMALNVKTPFMSIGYMPKVTQVLKDIGREDLLISMEDFLLGKYFSRLLEKIIQAPSEKIALSSITNSVQQAAYKNFALLNQMSER